MNHDQVPAHKYTYNLLQSMHGFQGGVLPRGDVYSYEILLLEMFTGKRPTDDRFTGDMNLRKWVGEALSARFLNN
ncbi:hypothetical protein H6P81_007486 [Aristolochia fimbriata]|uniref:Serine-threonine/tyrosine-protein kinase catalytic domain-containing protein n=1 Tax=Aristolochia fimbriata TaxID=158543 RepID=A0AAV7F0J7_ARIFI|nr:hypothetical protein H6P81_007486 [Aristolochia fimbriata]